MLLILCLGNDLFSNKENFKCCGAIEGLGSAPRIESNANLFFFKFFWFKANSSLSFCLFLCLFCFNSIFTYGLQSFSFKKKNLEQVFILLLIKEKLNTREGHRFDLANLNFKIIIIIILFMVEDNRFEPE